MRLSDLIGAEVTTVSGSELGSVREVRFVEADPAGRLVADGLIVSRHAIGARLGLDRPGAHGLALLRAIQRLLNRDAVWVPFERVVRVSDGTVSVRDSP